jgi:hypothetical protein
MMFFARPGVPKRFASPEHHQIKGLNVETIAGIHFPSLAWMNSPEYITLRADSDDDDTNWGVFSLTCLTTANQSSHLTGTTCGSLCMAEFVEVHH